jgi:asparagine synthase (glutamine-hydrolysing)
MCGICGFISPTAGGVQEEHHLQQMCRTLVHRGPDAEGFYCGPPAYLAMRRLSIIDLVTGQQPVTNEDNTIWLVFNGEIYNYRQLRHQLEARGHHFASQSDTEVIVHAYEEYGVDCLEQFMGMFAIALWDSAQQRLWLARDRLGIKPLYYWCDGQQIVFGSELKAVVAHPDVPLEIDLAALDQFLTLEYIPAPRTIYQQVLKLPAGHQLFFQGGEVAVTQYWDVPLQDVPGDSNECQELLAELLENAVRLRLVSDVPLGAFLSGGIDSSTVVSFMSQAVPEPIKTFSIGFEDTTYNELPDARTVASHFQTDHHEEILRPNIAALAEQLVGHFDEPFGDFSIFPTYLISQLASRSVKVILSGDGGDELFGGYESYAAQRLDRYYRWLPATVRQKTLPALLNRVAPRPAKKGFVNKTKRFVEGAALPDFLQHTRWMLFLTGSDKQLLYRPDIFEALDGQGAEQLLRQEFEKAGRREPLAQQQYVDVKTYLAEDILTKVDRMSMAASIEARVPFLDHRIVTFALNLPPHLKMHRGVSKVILRRTMRRRLPDLVFNKPKQGFSIPLKHWLRGPLRPLMTDLLSAGSLSRQGFFHSQTVENWVREHLAGKVNHSHRLWALMVFQLWYQKAPDRVHSGG